MLELHEAADRGDLAPLKLNPTNKQHLARYGVRRTDIRTGDLYWDWGPKVVYLGKRNEAYPIDELSGRTELVK